MKDLSGGFNVVGYWINLPLSAWLQALIKNGVRTEIVREVCKVEGRDFVENYVVKLFPDD